MAKKEDQKIRINCWEFKQCPEEERKKCPAYPSFGRLCFSLKGTLCNGEVQGDYQEKIQRCRSECGYYKMVIGE